MIRTAIEQTRQQNRLKLTEDGIVTAVNVLFGNKSIHRMTVKDFREIINKNFLTPCSVGFWKRKLNIDITSLHWHLAAYSNKETRLRVLQWKILHNIYPTKILLFKIG